jgi:16S rRNA G966 N2-methylase RsmD
MKIFQKLLENEVQHFIQTHLYEDAGRLMLKKSPFPAIEMRHLVGQIQAKRKAQTKLPSWFSTSGLVFPPLLNLEQSSSEETARFKAALMQGRRLADLTGGFGIDCAFWADAFEQVDYVERNEELAAIAAHNFQILGKSNIRVHVADAQEWLQNLEEPLDAVYIDPARRDAVGNKVFRLSDCEPDVPAILPLLAKKTRQVLIKTSPMLDISAALADLEQADASWQVTEVTVLAVHNECKEVLYCLRQENSSETQIHAVNLTDSGVQAFTFSFAEEKAATIAFAMPQAFFFEPNAALLKAGAFKTPAARFHLQKLHPHTHLYTSEQRPEDFPGRVFRLTAVCKADRKAILAHLPQGKAHLAVRNFPASVAELRKRWGIAEGGETYLFAVTLADGQKAVLIGEKD